MQNITDLAKTPDLLLFCPFWESLLLLHIPKLELIGYCRRLAILTLSAKAERARSGLHGKTQAAGIHPFGPFGFSGEKAKTVWDGHNYRTWHFGQTAEMLSWRALAWGWTAPDRSFDSLGRWPIL